MNTELLEELQEALGSVYRLERELIGGGMSRVFVAQETSLGRRVVLKVLPHEMAGTVNVERFRREIQLAASLLHPHIIPLLSAGEALGIPYYTMPYVEGESLRERLATEWQLPVAESVRLAGEVARALDYAHRRGIVHRDMKPDNILGHDGHALVADFGIARAISEAARRPALTTIGMAIGTPAYMSPEQGTGEREIDGRSDIYSLGCVLFEMLSGAPPYPGMSAGAILVRHVHDPIPSVRAIRSEVPAAIDRVIMRALAKDPGDRFATAADLVGALEDARSTHAAPPRATAVRPSGTVTTATTPERFVAVLPFANMSADPENEYFSDGITEDIIAQLSKLRGLKVMSRTSTMRFKQRPESIRALGRDLGVSHVLEGSVRRSHKTLRIVAQLIDAHTDEHVWSETFDREMTDIFAIQTEVAVHIARVLQTRLTPTDRSRLAKKPTDDLEAYNLYLLGRHHYNKVTPADFAKALDYYRRAIERDPKFARAYAALAEAQLYLGNGYWGIRPHDTFPEAYVMASKALELDPDSAEANSSLAMYHEWYEYDFDQAGAELKRAVDLNPSGSMIRMLYAMHLCALGNFDEAIVQRDVAVQLDPGAMAVRGNASWILYLARRMDQALADGRSLREVEPTSAYAAFSHGLMCAQAGVPREAVAAFRDAVALSGGASIYVVMLAYALAMVGEHDEARGLLADVARLAETEFVWPMGLAMAHAHLGDESIALDYLERAYDERVGWMLLLSREPALDILRSTPRFQALLQKIGPAEAIPAS